MKCIERTVLAVALAVFAACDDGPEAQDGPGTYTRIVVENACETACETLFVRTDLGGDAGTGGPSGAAVPPGESLEVAMDAAFGPLSVWAIVPNLEVTDAQGDAVYALPPFAGEGLVPNDGHWETEPCGGGLCVHTLRVGD